MNRAHGLVITLIIASASVGCQSGPAPGTSAARVHVIAKPKAGVKQTFARVPTYDGAPGESVRSAGGGQYERVDYSNLQDIIVWLEPAKTATSGAARGVELEIDPKRPDPTVHPASVGRVITFRNRTTRPLPLYSVSDGNDFELRPIAPGATATYTVRSEGLIELLSNPAEPPIAQVYAAPSPFVARTRSGKGVSFNDVPPGSYRVMSWHPRLPSSSTNLDLQPDKVSETTITVGVDAMRQSDSR
jgi:hypothetical protein